MINDTGTFILVNLFYVGIGREREQVLLSSHLTILLPQNGHKLRKYSQILVMK